MQRCLLVLFTVLAMTAIGCGDGNKPPLTPDTEHADLADAGAPATPPASATPASATPAVPSAAPAAPKK